MGRDKCLQLRHSYTPEMKKGSFGFSRDTFGSRGLVRLRRDRARGPLLRSILAFGAPSVVPSLSALFEDLSLTGGDVEISGHARFGLIGLPSFSRTRSSTASARALARLNGCKGIASSPASTSGKRGRRSGWRQPLSRNTPLPLFRLTRLKKRGPQLFKALPCPAPTGAALVPTAPPQARAALRPVSIFFFVDRETASARLPFPFPPLAPATASVVGGAYKRLPPGRNLRHVSASAVDFNPGEAAGRSAGTNA